MKLLTLNTHSHQEENQQKKLEQFVETVLAERPDIIALQEVSQSCDAPVAEESLWEGQFLLPAKVPLRQDNYGAQVVYRLRQAGVDCFWAWLPLKRSYEKYEEGVALLSLGRKITHAESCFISRKQDFQDWRTRGVLGVQTEGRKDWFYSVHMGWWDDVEEPFSEQWERLQKHLQETCDSGKIWLMGDFNGTDFVAGENYDAVRTDGWQDTFLMAKEKDCGITVKGKIDGWQENAGLRLDYIFCSAEENIESSRVVFNGENRPVVSDHFGVMIQTKEK